MDDVFRGVVFKTGREGLEGLYASAHFKNGADVKNVSRLEKS